MEYIVFKMNGSDVLKVLGKLLVEKFWVLPHYGVGLILQLEFDKVRGII